MKYVKYRAQKLQVSYDDGETWEDTGEYRKGEYLGVYSTAEECANAIVPPHETVTPQANPGAKATLILDDGTEVDLPFTGFHWSGEDSGTSTYFVDDYAFTRFDTSMTFVDWSTDRKDYVAQHCIKIILNNQIEYVCLGLIRGTLCITDDYIPDGRLTFDPSAATANDRRGYYKNLREIVIQNNTKYVSIDGHQTQVTKIWIPQGIERLNLYDFVYIDDELTIQESFSGDVSSCYYHNGISSNTVKKLVSYTDTAPDPGGSWDSYGTVPHVALLYNATIPDTWIVDLPEFTYVRDELVTSWYSAYLRGQDWQSTRRHYVPFFPLSIYNTNFRSPNDNEKFVARLSDGTLYSVPIGDGIVTSGDVTDIRSRICDIKFGSGVVKINKSVFGEDGIVESVNPRHHINLVEFNSNVDLSECDATISIDKVKLNGNNFFNNIESSLMVSPSNSSPFYGAVRYIFVPDVAFKTYVKSLPVENTVYMQRADSWRLKFRPMSSFKINEV